MSVYVVDYENVKTDGLKGIEKLLDNDVVVIFYSSNQPNIPIKSLEKIQESKALIKCKEAAVKLQNSNKSFHDALDAQLDTYIGYLIGKYNDKETMYYIVSEDQGFDFVCQYWQNRGYQMQKIKNISCGNLNQEVQSINEAVFEIFKEKELSDKIAKIIRQYKTKNGIYARIVKEYKQEKGLEIYKQIKPVIKNKK